MFEKASDLLGAVVGCDGGPGPGTGSLPSSALSTAQLVDRIAATERLIDALHAEQARDLAAFADKRFAEDKASGIEGRLQGRTIGTEIGLALGVAGLTAAGRVERATAAVECHPQLLELCGSGRVAWAGLSRVVKQTAVLAPDLRRVVDAQLAADATTDRLTPANLERAAIRRTLAADPQAAANRAAAARADRHIRLSDPADGTAAIIARLPAEQALAVHTSLDTRARALRADGDERTLPDLMCDLLVEDVTGHRLAPEGSGLPPPAPDQSPPRHHPDPEPDDVGVPEPYQHDHASLPDVTRPRSRRLPLRVEVQIVMSAATLLGLDDEPALLRGYGAIPISVAQEIADNADHTALRGLFCDPTDGRLVAMDAKTRFYAGPLRQFSTLRDQRCRLTDARIVDIDHVEEAQHGGPTTARNAQPLGKNAHVVKDHPGVRVNTAAQNHIGNGLDHLRRHAPTLTWTMPTGHTYLMRPPPALDWGSRPTPSPAPEPPQPVLLPPSPAPLPTDQRRRSRQRAIRTEQRRDLRRAQRQALRLERREQRIDRSLERQQAAASRQEALLSDQRRRSRR